MAKLRAGLSAALLFSAGSAQADWRRYETAHFIIYSENPDPVARSFADRLEGIDGLMRMATALPPQVEAVKVRIYEVKDNGAVERALGEVNSGIAGFYDSNIMGPFAVTPRRMTFGSGDFTRELVLHHEYAHHFMLQYFPATYPAWYVEGFAELIGSSDFMADGKIAYGRAAKHRGDAIAFQWVPVQELLLKPPEKIHELDLYGQGWALTHFLTFSKERSPQLKRYLAALNAGRPPAEAARAFGDLAKLNREAHLYVGSGSFEYRPVAVPITQPVILSVTPVSGAEADLIPETIAFRDDELSTYRKTQDRERERQLRAANLRRIEAKAARYANDLFALYLLAQAEQAAGNFDAAESAADRLLKLDPNHVGGMVVKSTAIARKGSSLSGTARSDAGAAARRLALKANHADPNDPLPMLAFYLGYRLLSEKPSAPAVEALENVVSTLPANTQIRQMLVDEYASQGRWRQAIGALAPIANSTHESPRRQAARELTAKLQAELGKPLPATAR